MAPARRALGLLALVLCLGVCGCAGRVNDLLLAFEDDAPSRSIGTPSAGSLIHGKRMPSRGPNFRAYSELGALLGRAHLHHTARAVLLSAYRELEQTQPAQTFIYGELGWPNGGPFKPHRTHQHGMSLDLMVPLKGGQPLPCWPWNKLGYGVEFDDAGQAGELAIDFDALAAMILAVDRAAKKHQVQIERIIYAPKLRARLFRAAPKLKSLPWLPRKAWVRHDEHIHIDLRADTPTGPKPTP